MSCGCSGNLSDGQAIVDHVKSKGKQNFSPKVPHIIICDCGQAFTLETVIMNCPNCEMTFVVKPCGSADVNNIKQAGIKYA